MNFAQRVGVEPTVRPIQKGSMDRALRNCLWNEFDMLILENLRNRWAMGGPYVWSRNSPNAALFVRLRRDFYKQPLTTLPRYADDAEEIVHGWFFDTDAAPWNRV